ncbi:MAG: PAS domain S-box protein [Gemmatimonadaceae bacterium]
MSDPSSPPAALRPSDVDVGGLIAALPEASAEQVCQLARERDALFVLHEALLAAERAQGLEERLRRFVEALRELGFGRVVLTLRDAAMSPTLVVAAGLSPEDERALRDSPSDGDTWRRRMARLEPYRVSQSYYLPGGDPSAAREFDDAIPSRLTPGGADPLWSPRDALIVPLRGAEGRIVATLVLDDPEDYRRPTVARVRVVELFAQQMAWIVEQAHLGGLADRRAARLQRVYEAGAALGHSLDEREVAAELARQARDILCADAAVVALPDIERARVAWAMGVAADGERWAEPAPFDPQGVLARAARKGRPTRVPSAEGADVLALAYDVGSPLARSAGTVLAVPLLLGDRLVAVLAVHAAARPSWSAEDEEMLLTVGAQAAAAMANARLYAESQRERRQSEALAEIARAVSESLRLSEVFPLILRHAAALLRGAGATLSLRRGDELEVVSVAGDGESLLGMRLPIGASLSGRVLERLTPMLSNDAPNDPLAYPDTQRAAKVRRAVAVPLVTGRGALGVLSVFNRPADFTDDDVRVLQRLADAVAVAVVNAQLFEEVTAKSEAVANSETRYRNLFETATDAIYTVDANGLFTSVNHAVTGLTGLARAEILGRSFVPFIDPEELPRVRKHFKAALAGQSSNYECQLVLPSGERRLLSVTNTPIRQGLDVVGVLGIARDVTDDRARAAALARSEARYARLVESASDAIFTVDDEGRFTSVNRALERTLGRSRAALLGASCLEMVDPADRQTLARILSETLAGQRTRGEFRFADAEGVRRTGSIITAPVVEDGRVTGGLGVVRDVTDEKRLAEQLLQQEKLAAIGQLVSGVAHELNNPLAGVMAFAQLLLASPTVDGEDRFAAETIHQESKRAAKIVSNLLTFARQHPPERRVADLNRVVEDTLELRRYALRMEQVELEVQLDGALPLTWADPFQLQQVVLNLLTNAEQALTDWDGPRRVRIATAHEGGRLALTVSDSGPGIAPESVDRIFNPFFTTKPVGQGTGLGLSISDGIVREHGGRIRVESVPGRGATFVVELPVVAPEEMLAARPGSAASIRGGGTASAPSTGVSVLVVDDEPAIRSAVSSFLRGEGHAVETVGTGAEALERIGQRHYDAMLLDLRMPGLTGDALFLEVRRRDAALARRVVFVTGDVRAESAAHAMIESTGLPVLLKPFSFEDLAAALHSVGVGGRSAA